MIIDFGEGIFDFYRIQRLSQVFLKILKSFSGTYKNFNSFEIKNNLIVKIDFKIDRKIDCFNRISQFLKWAIKIDLQIKLIFQIDFVINFKIDLEH